MPRLIIPVAVLLLAVSQVLRSLETFEISVTPFEQSALPGANVTFVCADDKNVSKAPYFTWTYGGENDSLVLIPTSGRISAVNGTLVISNVSHADAGTYKCDDDAGSPTQTGILIVYEMPDYTKEGIIIGCIGGGLFIVMLVGVIIIARNEYMAKKRRKSEKDARLLTVSKAKR